MSTLVVAEHSQGRLREVTLELLSAARGLGSTVTVALVGGDLATLVPQVNVAGVDEIVVVSVAADEFESDVYREAVERLIDEQRPETVLLGFTVSSMGYAPGLAATHGLGFASDVISLRREDGGLVVERSLYGGKVYAELDFPGKECILLLLRPGVWPQAEGVGSARVGELALAAATSRARHQRFVERPSGDVDITKADFVLAIGRGIGAEDAVEPFRQLADKMGAVLCASRPLVDAGWLPSARQVGQSGNTVKPKIYLALGISGAVQHLAGMKGSGTIIAVNSDPEAAIFRIAHFGAVADLFDVADELAQLY